MAITIPLETLSVEDKLQMMETLWDSLCATAEGVQSPAWHQETLARRADAVKNGNEQFEDWDKAKADIRKRTS